MFPLPEPMRLALDAARRAGEEGEVPVGAVIVRHGQVVSVAANAPRRLHDPTAHAEIQAIRAATGKLGRERLEDCDLCAPVPSPMPGSRDSIMRPAIPKAARWNMAPASSASRPAITGRTFILGWGKARRPRCCAISSRRGDNGAPSPLR